MTAKRSKKQIEQRISKLCDNFQQPNICVIVLFEAGKRDGDGGRRYIWRNNDCISSKFDRNYKPADLRRSTNPKFQNMTKATPVHVTVKFFKSQKALKSSQREKKYIVYIRENI